MRKRTYRVQAKREMQKDEIARIAARLFEEKGFEKVSLLQIADRYGKGRTTLYEYFQDKNELLAFCLEREMGVYLEKVMNILRPPGTFKDKVREFFKVQLVYGTAHAGYSRLFRSLANSTSGLASKTRGVIKKLHGEVYAALQGEIGGAIRRGEIREAPIPLVMQLLINATSMPIRVDTPPERTVEEILAVFWNGLGTDRKPRTHAGRGREK